MNLGEEWVVSAAISSYSDSRTTWWRELLERGFYPHNSLLTLIGNVQWWYAMTVSDASTVIFASITTAIFAQK